MRYQAHNHSHHAATTSDEEKIIENLQALNRLNVQQWMYVILIANQWRLYGFDAVKHLFNVDLGNFFPKFVNFSLAAFTFSLQFLPQLAPRLQFLAPLPGKISHQAEYTVVQSPLLSLNPPVHDVRFVGHVISAAYLWLIYSDISKVMFRQVRELLSTEVAPQLPHIINTTVSEMSSAPFAEQSMQVLFTVCIGGRIAGLVSQDVSPELQRLADEMNINGQTLDRQVMRMVSAVTSNPHKLLYHSYLLIITLRLGDQLSNHYLSNAMTFLLYGGPLFADTIRVLLSSIAAMHQLPLVSSIPRALSHVGEAFHLSPLALSTRTPETSGKVKLLQAIAFIATNSYSPTILKIIASNLSYLTLSVALAYFPQANIVTVNIQQLILSWLTAAVPDNNIISFALQFLLGAGFIKIVGEVTQSLPNYLQDAGRVTTHFAGTAKLHWDAYWDPLKYRELGKFYQVHEKYEQAIAAFKQVPIPTLFMFENCLELNSKEIKDAEGLLTNSREINSTKLPPNIRTYVSTQAEIAFCQLALASKKLTALDSEDEYNEIEALLQAARHNIQRLIAEKFQAFRLLQCDLLIFQLHVFSARLGKSPNALNNMLKKVFTNFSGEHNPQAFQTEIVTAINNVTRWLNQHRELITRLSYEWTLNETIHSIQHHVELYQQLSASLANVLNMAIREQVELIIVAALSAGHAAAEEALSGFRLSLADCTLQQLGGDSHDWQVAYAEATTYRKQQNWLTAQAYYQLAIVQIEKQVIPKPEKLTAYNENISKSFYRAKYHLASILDSLSAQQTTQALQLSMLYKARRLYEFVTNCAGCVTCRDVDNDSGPSQLLAVQAQRMATGLNIRIKQLEDQTGIIVQPDAPISPVNQHAR